MVVSDSDLQLLAATRGGSLRSLEIWGCKMFSEDGLEDISRCCMDLRSLSLQYIDIKNDYRGGYGTNGKWLHELALFNTVMESLDFEYPFDCYDIEDVTLLAKKCSNSLVLTELYLKLVEKLHRRDLSEAIGNHSSNSQRVESCFTGAVSESGDIKLQGRVKDGVQHLRKVENVNISTMGVYRVAPRKQAVMVIAVDEKPSEEALKKIDEVPAIEELDFLALIWAKCDELGKFRGDVGVLILTARGDKSRVDGCFEAELTVSRPRALQSPHQEIQLLPYYHVTHAMPLSTYMCNSVVFTCILNSLSPDGAIYAKSAYELWNDIKETYDKVDGSANFNPHTNINSLTQSGSSLAEYYNNLNSLLALQLVADGSDAGSIKITYTSLRATDDIDTPLICNMVANISESGDIKLQGRVKDGVQHLTKVGAFEVDVRLDGHILLCKQVDEPNTIGSVASILGKENVNISTMGVYRVAPRKQAVMVIAVDEKPSEEALKKIDEVPAVEELVFLALIWAKCDELGKFRVDIGVLILTARGDKSRVDGCFVKLDISSAADYSYVTPFFHSCIFIFCFVSACSALDLPLNWCESLGTILYFFQLFFVIFFFIMASDDASKPSSSGLSLNFGDPLYLHPNDTDGSPIVTDKLTRTENYKVWSIAMTFALRNHNKIGFIDGSYKKNDSDVALANQ
ncbi:ACT domain-containing protein [Tanacetum coccineum]